MWYIDRRAERATCVSLLFWLAVLAVNAWCLVGCAPGVHEVRGVPVYRAVSGEPSDATIGIAFDRWMEIHGTDALDGLSSVSFQEEPLPMGWLGMYDFHYRTIWVRWTRDCRNLSVLYHELAHHTYRLGEGDHLELVARLSWERLLLDYRCLAGELESNVGE